MTKEEVEKLVNSKKYSNAIKYYGDDKSLREVSRM